MTSTRLRRRWRSWRGAAPRRRTYLSLAHLPRNLVEFSAEWFPPNRRGWMADGFDLYDFFEEPGRDAWEVAPACHFWNGGVRIDEQ